MKPPLSNLFDHLMINWWFGFLGSPYERVALRVLLKSQTANPNHQLILG